ncbi:MAG: membrane lipoprotein lipid attachment site-containing protein [Betaproteobacteria bacterium]|nr:membrane lipoprotein lipid attachment site-containing protein [Betaproteobacteria bacterium]
MKKLLFVMGALFLVSACTERQQVIDQASEKRYQGKRDTQPWDNDPLAYAKAAPNSFAAPSWNKGDRASWETQIKARNERQNENKRIGD